MNDDEIHFETEDYKGRRIICTKSSWFHICEGEHHKYMEDEQESIIDALQNPERNQRYIDIDYPNRRAYYSYNEGFDYYTKVVVEFENDKGEGIGKIVTAYQPDDKRPGERPELT